MSVIIRTAYHTHPVTGQARITAKGGGRQRTIPLDHSKSAEWNHGNAAGEVALLLFVGKTAREIAVRHIAHDQNDDGTRHSFKFMV